MCCPAHPAAYAHGVLNLMFSVTHVSIPLNSAVFAALLWTSSAGLMLAASFATDNAAVFAWWAILLAIAAVGCTVAAVINHARKVVLDVMSWEHNLIRCELASQHGDEAPEALRVVPAPRGTPPQASSSRSRVD